jgi:hypothetical protein
VAYIVLFFINVLQLAFYKCIKFTIEISIYKTNLQLVSPSVACPKSGYFLKNKNLAEWI